MSALAAVKGIVSFGSSVSRAESKVSSLQKSNDDALGSKVAVEAELAEFDAGLEKSDEAPATLSAKRRDLTRRLSDATSDATLAAQLLEGATKRLDEAKHAAAEEELAGLVRIAQNAKQKATKEITVELKRIREIIAPSFLAATAARDLASGLKAKGVPWDLAVNVEDVAGDLNREFQKAGGGPHMVAEISLLVPLK